MSYGNEVKNTAEVLHTVSILKGKQFNNEEELIEVFQSRVAMHPDEIAILDKDSGLTYKDLDLVSNQYANYLLDIGMSENSKILLHLERSIEMLVCMIAILKVGASYIPLDPKYTTSRVRTIYEHSKPQLVISSLKQLITEYVKGVRIIFIEDLKVFSKKTSYVLSILKLNQKRVAYVMYTSGSTGEPKGVEIKINGILRLSNSSQLCSIKSTDRVAFGSSVSFDTSVFEIWGALLNGATLVVLKPSEMSEPKQFQYAIKEYAITTLWLTSSNFNNLYKYVPYAFSDLTNLLIGGEALNRKIVMELVNSKSRPTNIINAYGPTEASTFALAYKINTEHEDTDTVPIGKPISNTMAYVLDTNMCLVRQGEIGELYIGGEGIAKGYLNNVELSGKKFVNDPYSGVEDASMYSTGDIVRMLPDTNIEYIGRRDQQVKLRGFRIELGDIEMHMQQFYNVIHAAVIMHDGGLKGNYLVGYFSHSQGHKIQIHQLRQHLAKHLPDYMLPSFFVSVDDMPLTPHGKVDKKALAQLHQQKSNFVRKAVNDEHMPSQHISPRNYFEQKVADIFSELLEIDTIYANDNFFDLGGHSLLVLRLISEVEDQFSCVLDVRDLYEHRTVEALALKIKHQQKTNKASPMIALKEKGVGAPLFLLHPIGGTSFCYLPLLRHFSLDRPVYSFQDPAVDDSDCHFDSLEEMASVYIQHMKTVQANGPYYLIGSSFGASMVIEMTRQLELIGDEVKVAVLIDGFSNFNVQKKGIDDPKNYLQELQEYMPGNVSTDSPFFNVLCERMEMLLKYKLRKVNTPLALFKAKELLPKFKKISSKDNGWNKYSSFPIKIHCVPGNHETMLADQNVSSLAIAIEDYILNCEQELQEVG